MKFLVDGSFQLRKKHISFIIESGLKSEEVSAKKSVYAQRTLLWFFFYREINFFPCASAD